MKKKTKKSLFAAMFLAVLGVGFAACEKNEPKNPDAEEYTLTVVSSDPLLGTTSGSGKYASGSSVKIVASPIGNAVFVSWSDCNVIDTMRVIKLTSDSTIVASFKEKNPDAVEYTLTVVSSDSLLGTTSGSGKYASGSSVKIVASPIGNAVFVSWSDCNVIDTMRVIKLTSDSTIVASFKEKNPDAVEYTLTVVSSDSLLGTTSGSGKYASGSSVKIVASPIGNAEFVSWSDCNVIDTMRIITLTSDSTIVASFKESIIWDETPTGYLGTHGYVDLGLPSGTLWATCNVGADKPTEYGNYFAWGEIVTKASYSSSNYNYSANPSVLPASADAATVHWGEGWRMPTTEQFYEFYDYTEHIHVNNYNGSGISGLILKSVTNGNHIFFPSNGYYMNEKNGSYGYSGYYWASGIADLSGQARRLWFDASTTTWDSYSRWAGYGVRPVVGAPNTDVVMTCAEAITHLNEAVIVEGYVVFAYDYNNGVQSAWIADDAATNVGVFQAYNCAVTQSVSKGDRVRVEGTMIQFTKTSGQTIYEIMGGTMTKL